MSSFVRAILQKEFVFSFDHNTKSTWWNLLLNIATMPVITSASEGNNSEIVWMFLTQRSHWPCGHIWPKSGPANHNAAFCPWSHRTLCLYSVTDSRSPAEQERDTQSQFKEGKKTINKWEAYSLISRGNHTNTAWSNNFILYRKSDKHIFISSNTCMHTPLSCSLQYRGFAVIWGIWIDVSLATIMRL